MTSQKTTYLAGAAMALLALSACSKETKLPEGQVVATVDGKDVTIHELNAELQTIPNAATAPRKLVEAVALARVIERKMLSTEADKLKLGNSPAFLLAKQRSEEGLLIQALQADIQSKVPKATREGAQKFITENPVVFGDRRIFTIDQIQFLKPANFEQLPLKEAKTMADVERILVDANIEYRRAPQQMDTLTINPQLTKEILKITASGSPEPFLFADQPQGAPAPVIFVNNVTGTKSEPFTGEKAITYAQNILQRQEIQKRLGTELEKWKAAYKTKIVYAKGYGAPDPGLLKAPAAAGAPAPAAAPAAG